MGSRFSPLALFLEDDLREHRAGDVLARLGVPNDELLALLHHLTEMVERHIARCRGIVEPPVRIFLDNDDVIVRG